MVAAFSPSPCSRIAARPLVDDLVVRRAPLLQREVEAREPRARARSRPAASTRSPSSSSSWPVSSPSRTTIVFVAIASDSTARGYAGSRWHEAGGWRRKGRKGRFRYYDSRGKQITDADKLARIEGLVIPPAWKTSGSRRVRPRSSRRPDSTKPDAASTSTTPTFAPGRSRRSSTSSFASPSACPTCARQCRSIWSGEPLTPDWVCALALRLINLGWFRVGSERYARTMRTFGITTLRKGHVSVRGSRITFKYRGKHRVLVRTRSSTRSSRRAMRKLLALPGGSRLFRYEVGRMVSATSPAPSSTTTSRAHGRRIHGQGFPHLGRHVDRRDRVRRAWAGGDGNRGQKSCRRSRCAQSGQSSGIPRPLRERHMSVLPSSSSIWMEERSTISDLAICA